MSFGRVNTDTNTVDFAGRPAPTPDVDENTPHSVRSLADVPHPVAVVPTVDLLGVDTDQSLLTVATE